MWIPKTEQKIEKNIFFFQITALELAFVSSGHTEQDTSNRWSICQQTHPRFRLKLGRQFPNQLPSE